MKLVLEYCFAHIYPLVIHSIYKLSRNVPFDKLFYKANVNFKNSLTCHLKLLAKVNLNKFNT